MMPSTCDSLAALSALHWAQEGYFLLLVQFSNYWFLCSFALTSLPWPTGGALGPQNDGVLAEIPVLLEKVLLECYMETWKYTLARGCTVFLNSPSLWLASLLLPQPSHAPLPFLWKVFIFKLA